MDAIVFDSWSMCVLYSSVIGACFRSVEVHKHAYSIITRLCDNDSPFYTYSATIAKTAANNDPRYCPCTCRHNLYRRRTIIIYASVCTKTERCGRKVSPDVTRQLYYSEGISTHTAVVPEQAPVRRGHSSIPHRDTKAARTTSRQVCACARLCFFACAGAPELLQPQPNILVELTADVLTIFFIKYCL